MSRFPVFLLAAAITPALSACLPMMAASAVGMAARSAQRSPVSNEALQPQARAACSAQAARYGALHIIDVEQRSIDKIIVWGTVETGSGKQSFQCDFGTAITGFRLRPITPAS
jgi:hypothetical protein